MQNLVQFYILVVLLIGMQAFAYAPREGNVNVIFGPYVHKSDFQGAGDRLEPPVLGGIGLIAQGDVNEKGSLEISLFEKNKAFFRDQGSDFLAEQTAMFYFTMGYRRWLSRYFSVASAFFSSYSIGEPEVIHRSVKSAPNFDTSATDITEYGFDFSVQGELWNSDSIALILDGRYSLSVTNKDNEHANEYGILLGLKFLIQEKYPSGKP